MRPSQTECHHLLMGFAISNKLRSVNGTDVTSCFPVSCDTGPDTDVIIVASAAEW